MLFDTRDPVVQWLNLVVAGSTISVNASNISITSFRIQSGELMFSNMAAVAVVFKPKPKTKFNPGSGNSDDFRYRAKEAGR